ncbi:TNT domain-containing protein [Streptomyces sp. NPDC006733]|uniref:TNT domain-containing protein n=1 Tax=Streptomyces sp. NPDC006733 TaxID=3155460 RepID=UPI0033D7787D
MKLRQLFVSLVAGALLATTATVAAAAPAEAGTARTECSATFYQGDPRLGPEVLPTRGAVGRELAGYHRTGKLSAPAFLARYNTGTGWIYPPQNGYVIGPDGRPVEWQQTLRPGQDIDRFGSEYGSFLAPEGLPYANRSIPPQSLDGVPAAGCNYHDYRVLKAFAVDAGPIAPWFAQPGYGLQYQLDAALVPGAPATINVMWLVANGYLQRLV